MKTFFYQGLSRFFQKLRFPIAHFLLFGWLNRVLFIPRLSRKIIIFLIGFNVLSLLILIPGFYLLDLNITLPNTFVTFDGSPGMSYNDSSCTCDGQSTDSQNSMSSGQYSETSYSQSDYGDSGPSYGDNSYSDTGYSDSGYGDSGYSNSDYGDTQYGDSGPPAPPTGNIAPYFQNPPLTSCLSVGEPNLTISWTASTNVTNYRVYFFDYAEEIVKGGFISNSTNYTFTNTSGLIPGHQYSFVIRASNATGIAYSDQDATHTQGTWSHQKFAMFTTFPDCNPPQPFSFDGSTVAACMAVNSPTMKVNWTTNNTLLNGLTAYYKMDEAVASAQVVDTQANAPGTQSNTGIATTGTKFGNARTFDGSTSSIAMGTSALLNPTNGMSISAWVNPSSISGDKNIVTRLNGGYNSTTWALWLRNGNPTFYLHGAGTCASSTNPVPINTWSLVTGTYDRNAIKVYVNGTLRQSCSATGPITVTSAPAVIGSNWAGMIDNTLIYNRALTSLEVGYLSAGSLPETYSPAGGANYYTVTPITNNTTKDNYTTPAGFRFDSTNSLVTNLLSYWNLDQSGNTLNDLKGTNNATGTASSTSVAAVVGNGRNFSGANPYLQTASVNLNLNSFSAGAWVYPTAGGCDGGGAGNMTILRQNSVFHFFHYQVAYWDLDNNLYICDGQAHLGLDISGKTISMGNGAVIPYNQWSFVAFTRNGTTGGTRYYINGVEKVVGTTGTGNLAAVSSPIQLGGGLGTNGKMDEVGLWNKQLSTQEVVNLYSGGNGNTYTQTGAANDGILAPIVVNNPPPGMVTSYTHQIPGATVAPGETWRYSVVAYNDWGSTTIGSNPSVAAAPAVCAAPTLTYSVTYTPVGGGATQNQTFPNTYVTTDTGRSITLNWNSSNATSCTGSDALTLPSGANISGTLNQGPLLNPPDRLKEYTLSCTNENLPVSVSGRSVVVKAGVNIEGIDPFIQTTQGDVHSNDNVNLP